MKSPFTANLKLCIKMNKIHCKILLKSKAVQGKYIEHLVFGKRTGQLLNYRCLLLHKNMFVFRHIIGYFGGPKKII